MENVMYRLCLTLAACSGFALLAAPGARAVETEVSTGIYYFPSDAEKLMRAQTETAEDGLSFSAPRDEREVAKDYAEEEMRNGNVCLRQLRRDLRTSVRQWRVRSLCEKVFQGHLEKSLQDAARAHLHPDHVECTANAEAREQGGSLEVRLAFRAQIVMRDRAPVKLRHAGMGGEVTRWDLPAQEDTLGSAAGSWKDALQAGACSADRKSLDKFWDRIQKRADEARELALCRDGQAREATAIARLQRQLSDYVPEDWVKDRAGDDYRELLTPVTMINSGSLEACRSAQATSARRLEELRKVSAKIADKYDVPALQPGVPSTGERSPASEHADEEEGD